MSEREIVEGLKAGDPAAFHALYTGLAAPILAYLTRILGRREMAEELTQETFLTAVRKIGFFRPRADGGLKSWLFRIASHRAIDLLRREKRIDFSEGPLEVPSGAPTAQRQLEDFEFSTALDRAIGKLSAAQRMIFLLREQEELSYLEISRVCGCSENAVKQALFRARGSLRNQLCE